MRPVFPAPAGAPAHLLFRLPLPPNIANPGRSVGGNWKASHFAKKKYMANAGATIAQQLGNIPTLFKADLRATFHVRTPFDQDNLMRLLKWPLDTLTMVGLVRDDREAYCRIIELPTQVAIGRIRRRKTESYQDYLVRRHKRDGKLGVWIQIWERTR